MLKYNLKKWVSYLPLVLMLIGLIMVGMYKTKNIVQVHREKRNISLYYSGVVKPINSTNVVSPFEGTITRLIAKTGALVHKGDVLFYMHAPTLETKLREAITAYLKAKSDYQNMLFQYNGNGELFKNGLIAKVDFLNNEAQYKSSQLALWDSEQQLKKILESTEIQAADIEKLSLGDIKQIQTILSTISSEIKILAPVEGILSSQTKIGGGTSKEGNQTSGEESLLKKGLQVKEGDIVAIIYEMTGLNFSVKINETNLQDIYIGQSATIKGPAFPSNVLHGSVTEMNHEANNATGDSIPTYTIRITVPNLTVKQRQIIEDGMSAEIALLKKIPPGIYIPIGALINRNGEYFVKRLNRKKGDVEEVSVSVGPTNYNSVEVTQGLSEGDEIVIPDKDQ